MTPIFKDRAGREVVQFVGQDGQLKLELWANPWHLDPDEARKLGLALFQWAVEHDGPADPFKK